MSRGYHLSLGTLLIVGTLTSCEPKRLPDCGLQTATSNLLLCDEVERICHWEERTVRYDSCQPDFCEANPGLCWWGGDGSDCRAALGNSITGVEEWVLQTPLPNTHVVDGAFTENEWASTTEMQGLFTDVYMDYRDGRLYFLNDWRANEEGIRSDCFNFFGIRVADDFIDLKVFGDGHVEVERRTLTGERIPIDLQADGAYGFGPSPTNPTPHTIYEFSLEIEAELIDVCCFDPISESQCEELAAEPMAVSLRTIGNSIQTRRSLAPGSVERPGPGEPCGSGQGICEDGLRCEGAEGSRVCSARIADAGMPTDALPM